MFEILGGTARVSKAGNGTARVGDVERVQLQCVRWREAQLERVREVQLRWIKWIELELE